MATAVRPNALFAKLLSALTGKPDAVPVGYLTAAQWAAKWSVTVLKAQMLLRAGVKSQLVECKKFKIQSGKVLRPVPHYCEK